MLCSAVGGSRANMMYCRFTLYTAEGIFVISSANIKYFKD